MECIIGCPSIWSPSMYEAVTMVVVNRSRTILPAKCHFEGVITLLVVICSIFVSKDNLS